LKAEFSADTTWIFSGGTVSFTDLSTGNPQAWLWDFGDFSSDISQNPVHQYLQKGIYSVTLQIFENDSTTSITKTDYIHVFDPLIAVFGASPNPAQINQEVQFTDMSTGDPVAWRWQFGDGKESTLQHPAHIYKSVGNFDIKLWIDNGIWQDSVIIENYLVIYPPTHLQTIPMQLGWSGISAFVNPVYQEMDSIFKPVRENLVFAWNENGNYQPSGQQNTLLQWNPADGLVVKMSTASSFEIQGYSFTDKTIEVPEGWSLLPVLSECSIAASFIEEASAGSLVIIKEIAGNNLYWPEEKVKTLQILFPGKCYFINSAKAVTITFPECE
jgi:hypothetical protein